MLWQGAAQRRRAHPRRTNVSLGVCSVDLSGPHEPTPRPGAGKVDKNPCRYFLALTLRPDRSARSSYGAAATGEYADAGVQTDPIKEERPIGLPPPPLVEEDAWEPS